MKHQIKVSVILRNDPKFEGVIEMGDDVFADHADTLEELKENLVLSIDEMKDFLKGKGIEVPAWMDDYELEFCYDPASFLAMYADVFSQRTISRLTGINQAVLSQYVSGARKASDKQLKRIEKAINELGEVLSKVKFA